MKKTISVVVGIALSAGLMALALRNVKLSEVASVLAEVRLPWLLVMAAIVVFDLVVRAVRWRLLLAAAGTAGMATMTRSNVWTLLKLEAVGLAVNNVLFARLGEFARAYLAGLELKIPALTAFSTIFVERALDMMALLTLFVAASFAHADVVAPAIRHGALAAIGGLGAGLLFLSFADGQLKSNGPWERRIRAYPRVHRVVEELAYGTMALRSPLACAQVSGLSLLLWLVDAGVYWAAGRALDIEPSLNYGRCVVTLATAAAASALPLAPGAFGGFEQFVSSLLVHWGTDAAVALGYAGLVHILPYLMVTFIGIVFLYRMGHSLGGLAAAIEKRRAKA